MNIGRQNQDAKVDNSWIPKTPFKPIPSLIYTDRQGNQINQANWSGSDGNRSNFTQEAHVDGECTRPDSSNCRWESGCREFSMNGSGSQWDGMSFSTLFALANSASLTCIGATSSEGSSLRPNQWVQGHSTPGASYETPVSSGRILDINFPARKAEASSGKHIPFAPPTPNKAIRTERKQVAELPSETISLGDNELESGVNVTENQTNKELQKPQDDSLSAPAEVENLNPDKGSNDTDVFAKTPQQKPVRRKHRPKVITEGKARTRKTATPRFGSPKENTTVKEKNVQINAPGKASETSPAELTRESADPRTKPAANKENTKGKRKYTQKRAVSEAAATAPAPPGGESIDTAANQETSTGKRKYVRRSNQKKASVSRPAAATKEATNEKNDEPTKKSCRRALNFDAEELPIDDRAKCKSSFNVETQPSTSDGTVRHQSKSIVQLGHGIEVVVETTQSGTASEFMQCLKQMLKDHMPLSEKPGLSTPSPSETLLPCEKQDTSERWSFNESSHMITQSIEGTYKEKLQLYSNTLDWMKSTHGFNCINSPILTIGEASGSKRKHVDPIGQLEPGSTNVLGIQYNSLSAYLSVFQNWHKKKRTEGGHYPYTSSTSSSITSAKDAIIHIENNPNTDLGGDPSTLKANSQILVPYNASARAGNLQHNLHNSEPILAQTERSSERTCGGPTQDQNLALLSEITSCMMRKIHQSRHTQVGCNGQQVANLQRPNTCSDALAAEMSTTFKTKTRTKKSLSLVNFKPSSSNKEQTHGRLIIYNQSQLSKKALGASAKVKQMSSADAIAEQLKHLDINRESYHMAYNKHRELVAYNSGQEMQNALVLYRRDGTIVPFDGPFEPVKRRPPRAKVDLDAETDRVWKLLLSDINSEGIDGTDEEKAKWWEEERNVFRGRADSFIARMHLVQGDRRFSPWKGSVVDSVVGVFLTQNVSDHLSSSAFMSLAAHFPLNSSDKHQEYSEGKRSSIIDEPIGYLPGQHDTKKWSEMSNQSTCDQISATPHYNDSEEREVVNSNASSGSSMHTVNCEDSQLTCESPQKSTIEATETEKGCMRGERLEKDIHSSQNSMVSSQNSTESPTVPIVSGKALFSENYFESEDLTDGSGRKNLCGCGSFVELLAKAGSSTPNEFCSKENGNSSSENHMKDENNRQQSAQSDLQEQKMDNSDCSKRSECPLELSIDSSSYCHFHLDPTSAVVQVECCQVITAEARYSDLSSNGKIKMDNLSAHVADSASQTAMDKESSMSPDTNLSSNGSKADGYATISSPNTLVEKAVIVGKSLDQERNVDLQQDLSFPSNLGDTLVTIESASEIDKQEKDLQKELIERRKAKSRRVGDEIRDDIDWEAIRKEVLAFGEKKERTQSTMDSVDWEAVRCADVNEIADTIKDRGMNNILAGRIKDFLNRLVTEHGSIDLEWLRDIPPDKAKEYLLTFRGLGLKSVECVRLLTLHHLAFPVDTNVGRIAVRLGWVPLQPLPESLHLHLLELYPVQESIQKYLWPRLCKLDQRTLYELHYQLITFGKVFCTKSKPNCNACPMRGECRHFASAFASARLALPGPEENRIVGVNETKINDKIPTVDRVHLALPEVAVESTANQQLIAKGQLEHRSVTNCEPIIEEPSSPEPQCQVTMNDIEDALGEEPDEIPTIKLNMEVFTRTLQTYIQQNMELQEGDMSKALVALTAEATSIPMPKLKNVSRLRTEHQVYELPDTHPLVEGLDVRELDDPSPYLLAIWTPGETADSIQPPESRCSAQEYGRLCDNETCFSCNCTREANSQTVRGTLLIPCRTAMRGSFPLNGTYFQVNEVFADHDSSLSPIDVPRSWIWNLPRRTVYFGTSVPNIFKGLTTEEIQHCFWRGFVCVRGFDQKSRAPRPLMARLHFPASKLKTKGTT